VIKQETRAIDRAISKRKKNIPFATLNDLRLFIKNKKIIDIVKGHHSTLDKPYILFDFDEGEMKVFGNILISQIIERGTREEILNDNANQT